MKQIELSQGLYTLVDDEDYIFLNQVKWSASYHKRTKRWVASNSKLTLLHRYLLGITDPCIVVRHKNGNTLDNRRENLEVISKRESRIRSKKKKGTNRYRGVTFEKTIINGNKWRVDIGNTCVGTFPTEKEAALAWNKVALEMYGENAQLNVVE